VCGEVMAPAAVGMARGMEGHGGGDGSTRGEEGHGGSQDNDGTGKAMVAAAVRDSRWRAGLGVPMGTLSSSKFCTNSLKSYLHLEK